MHLLLVTLTDNVFILNEDIKKLCGSDALAEVEVFYYDSSAKMLLVFE